MEIKIPAPATLKQENPMKTIVLFHCFIFILALSSQSEMDFSGLYLNELIQLKKVSRNKIEAGKLHAQAMEKHKKKDHRESERLWYLTAKADPAWVEAYFNLACSTAMQGMKPDIAISYLEIALGMDKKKVLPWAKNDPDLASIRGEARYSELMDRYSGASRTIKDTLSIMHEALTGNDLNRFMTIIHGQEGFRLAVTNGKNIDSLYERTHIGTDILAMITRDSYAPVDFTEMGHMNGGDPNVKVLYVQTNYRKDPPGSPMRCESWRDNFYFFKIINGIWYLIKFQSNGNGGC